MKDLFSTQSDRYAQFRPSYPPEVLAFVETLLPVRELAWDCGTGNGQMAIQLARSFRQVYATDISQSQLDNAQLASNIIYSVQPAEHTDFARHSFDLIVVAQAIHWFDFERFYDEVRRTAKRGALLCVLGYGRFEVAPAIDALIDQFYTEVIGAYWDKERRYIDEHYQTIPFPFPAVKTPSFVHQEQWTLEHLVGYLYTWSAVKRFIQQNGNDPLTQVIPQLQQLWQSEQAMSVRFPILLRLGRVE